ncbi:DNA/RNA non-specific endonuclease, partial [Salmonella enterica subsp. enterica serovar Goldcoast]|nr:DNA/RNA non-specific endonuclease [Salmonella enterica subsp. enterica serovar Goldcoast]
VLTLWSALPEAVAREVKTTKGSLAQKLGCR